MSHPVIAIVDDNQAVLQSLQWVIESNGFEVLAFSSGAEALRAKSFENVSCVLTDFDMLIMDGSELQLHLGGAYPELPVIFCSGNSDEAARVRVLRRGAFAFLSKPARVADLVSTIYAALERKSARQMLTPSAGSIGPAAGLA